MSLDTLKLAPALNSSTLRSMTFRQDPELEQATWDETVEEEKKGWIWFDDSRHDDGLKFVGRSFGIQQSSKTRVIDDCSCCGLNWTVGLHEKFQLQSIDVLASMLAAAFKLFPGNAIPDVLGSSRWTFITFGLYYIQVNITSTEPISNRKKDGGRSFELEKPIVNLIPLLIPFHSFPVARSFSIFFHCWI